MSGSKLRIIYPQHWGVDLGAPQRYPRDRLHPCCTKARFGFTREVLTKVFTREGGTELGLESDMKFLIVCDIHY